MAEIAKVVKAHDTLLIVDGITAVGGLENRMDDWGIDALVMGSQKCLAAPAGLSAVALSKRAYESLHSDTSFYTNLKAHVDALAKQDTPYTPAVPLFLAFREALILLRKEGLPNRITRTTRNPTMLKRSSGGLWCRLAERMNGGRSMKLLPRITFSRPVIGPVGSDLGLAA